MFRWFGAGPAVTIAIAALVAAGCGSGSSKTTSKTPAASTPAVPSTPSTASTPTTGGTGAYPPVLRAAFLRGCERKSTSAKCDCAITYLQAHVPLAAFVKDVQEEQATHKLPPGLQAAVTACKNK